MGESEDIFDVLSRLYEVLRNTKASLENYSLTDPKILQIFAATISLWINIYYKDEL